MRQQYGKFRFEFFNLPQSFIERGIDDADTLPSYIYRSVFCVMTSFVLSIITKSTFSLVATDTDC